MSSKSNNNGRAYEDCLEHKQYYCNLDSNKNDFFEFIKFNNKQYPCRIITLYGSKEFEGETVSVSTTSLSRALFDENEFPISKKTECIDDGIFYFVQDDEIFLDEKILNDLIIENL